MEEQISANKRRSTLLVGAFFGVLLIAALALDLLLGGGLPGLLAVFVAAAAVVSTSYWMSDRLVLAMSHARPAHPVEQARLHNVVEGLCIAAGLPKPRVFVIEDDALNAFATGRGPKHASITVTTGLLSEMSRVELEAVLAHELVHVKNYDILLSTLAVTMVGAVTLVADWGLRFRWWGGPRHRDDQSGRPGGAAAVLALPGYALLLLSPIAGRAMQTAISRRRETLADVTGVALTRYPPGLISALEKLRAGRTVVHSGSPATAHLWIESPVARADSEGRLAWLGRLFDTHPPLDERILALREL